MRLSAKMIADNDRVREKLTDDVVIGAMSPTPEKYGVIVSRIEKSTGLEGHILYRVVDAMLQRMRRAGRVELVKGCGAGWRINTGAKP